MIKTVLTLRNVMKLGDFMTLHVEAHDHASIDNLLKILNENYLNHISESERIEQNANTTT